MSPVMAILQDHLLVPSRTISSACSRLSMCVSGSTENVVLKRRQCPRHRFVLRQPPVPNSRHWSIALSPSVSFYFDSQRRQRSFGHAGILQRPPKDVVGLIQRHPAAAAIQPRLARVMCRADRRSGEGGCLGPGFRLNDMAQS